MTYKISFLLGIVFPLLSYSALAQNSKTSIGDEKEIIDIEHRWVISYVKRDTDYLERLFANDAIFINTRGETIGKEQEIMEVKTGAVVYESFETFDVKPKIYNNTAVVTAWSHLKAKVIATGRVIDVKFTVLDIFVRKNESEDWKLVATQATEIKK